MQTENKMGIHSVKKLLWKMGLPMIVSMILQAIYNIVDTAFVMNMSEYGTEGNLALTYAFPIQLLIIAIGVGTGVGINALLSRHLGEGDQKKASMVAGNGIFLGIVIYLVFLLFGIFGAHAFISFQAAGNEKVIEMGTVYLQICCCLSMGAIGFTIYERFLQASGKTGLSTISQVTGALLNIILDYVFIYPCKMGIAGAAWATIIGQIASLIMAMIFHYTCNKEISGKIKYIRPSWKMIKGIYQIGITAAIMQGLLSVMMLGLNIILGYSYAPALLQGSFGIYYKIQQFALFAAFGMSNTIISLLSYNYGLQDQKRSMSVIKWGIIDSVIVCFIITILFQILATPLAMIFNMTSSESTGEIQEICETAIHIASIGYVFMGFTVAIQGVLQSLRYSLAPMILSFLRLVLFIFPLGYIFGVSDQALSLFWVAFPITEFLTALISIIYLKRAYQKKILPMNPIPEKQ